MRQNLHLYIGDMEVEFNQPPDILYTFQTTELTNPTVIKNSFSKQITIYGSPQNNNIFGQYWNVERLQGTANGIGAYFNPSKKVPFTLYINGDIYESGYVKLDEVKIVEGKSIEYNITLYGGLGQFFYNLSTDWNTGNKRTLADLNYYKWSEDTTPLDLSFTINKETVASAWTAINSNDVYSVINFAPVYAGIPDNIDADKVVMNFNGLSGFSSSVTVDNKTYTTNNGYALATLPQKLMAEEVRDYRSYLQTPIIRVKNVIDAICRKENNSGLYDEGYDVELDSDFFNSSNPYYYDSWMTLPSLTNLEFSTNGGVPTAWTGTWTSAVTNNVYTYTFPLAEPITEQNTTVTMSFDLSVVVPVMDGTGTVVNDLYMYYTRLKGRGTRVYYRNAYGLQLYASNSLTSNENVLAGSDVKWLTGTQKYDYSDAVATGQYSKKFNNSNVEVLVGNFVNCPQSIQYKFSQRLTFTCDLPVGSTCFKLQLVFTNSSNNSDRYKLSTSTQANTGTLRDIYSVMPFKTVPSDDKTITIQYLDDGDSYSNRYISKEMLLGTDFSPCDFLLSYCKQFGLYIYKDRVEDKIYIKTRKNFYHRDKVIDINDNIDRLNDIAVKPLNIDYGFFALTNSGESSSFYTDYVQKYGKIYGQKIIATGYDFNADTKNLIDSVFKGAVQSKEMSQYFFKPNNKVHPYMFNSVKYALYEQGNYESGSTDVNAPFKVIAEDFEPYDESFVGYDAVSQPMFYDSSKKPLGTEYVMLFFNGYQSIPAYYNWNLTDDIGAMYKLNNNPCWLLTTSSADTNGNTIALPITQFPRFSRWYEGNKWMTYSWDFGSPREIYVPDMTNNDEGNIYWNYFKTYYEDAYDVNSKIVEAYVINREFTQDDLRNFYWFDNALWVLNKIEDYNVTSFEGTKCTFLKVQDVNNYTNEDATTDLWIKVTLDKYVLPASGGTIVGTVRTSDNFGWQIEGICITPTGDSAYTVTIDPDSYGSSGNFIVTVPSNIGENKIVTINVTAGDIGGSVKFVQEGEPPYLRLVPTSISFDAVGGSATISVQSNVDWQIGADAPTYLTFEIINGGYLNWKAYSSSNLKQIYYSKDGGSTWTAHNSSTSGNKIYVDSGDVVLIKGDNNAYSNDSNYYNTFSGSTASFNLRGNIMSLIDSENFGELTTADTNTFSYMFAGTSVADASSLVLPIDEVGAWSYAHMFEGCTSLTKGPQILASSFGYHTCDSMFKNCSSLNYVKCLITSKASTSTKDWMYGAGQNGTFVKNADYTWSRGVDGVLTYWTIIDEGSGGGGGGDVNTSLSYVFASSEDFGEFNIEVTSTGGLDNVVNVDGISDVGNLATGLTSGQTFSVGVQNLNSLGKGTRHIGISYAATPNYNFVEVPSGQFTWVSGLSFEPNKIIYIQIY